MKKLLILLFALIFGNGFLPGQTLQAFLSYSVFNTPDGNPYIETYLVVNGTSVKYRMQEDSTFQAKLDVQIIFRQNDSIVNFDKYELSGPEFKDTLSSFDNLLDVERYALPNGNYDMEWSLKDRNTEDEPIVSNDSLFIHFSDNKPEFSDIELVHSYQQSNNGGLLEKNGYEIIPFAISYYPKVADKLSFYAELYNTTGDRGDSLFVLYYYIRPAGTDIKMNDFFFARRLTGQPVNILLKTIDISQLASGRYLLVLEARDRNNKVMAEQQKYFYRSNPNIQFKPDNMLTVNVKNTFAGQITSIDTLKQYIDFLYPISTEPEKNYAKALMKESNVETLQKYFLNFWLQRNSTDPENAWYVYKEKVDQVNHDFKALRIQGYKTDRGRVYLQYGPPNVISKSYNEPAAYPYEIWHYYSIGYQRDKRFVFFTKDIVTNDFLLIHSTVQGELHNSQWQKYIYGRTWDPLNFDEEIVPSSYGSFATDYYLQPR